MCLSVNFSNEKNITNIVLEAMINSFEKELSDIKENKVIVALIIFAFDFIKVIKLHTVFIRNLTQGLSLKFLKNFLIPWHKSVSSFII